MLKKINRISQRKDFEEVKSKGEMINSPLFGALCLINETTEVKFGFIISKKISKKAVERNKIKRRMSEILRKKLTVFKPGTKIIFLTKKSILGAKIAEVEKEIEKLISKA